MNKPDTSINFTEAVCTVLESVPLGRVISYGNLAAAAGSPGRARYAGRVLHSQSQSRGLPWHRVVSQSGSIVIKDSITADLQRELLLSEGISFTEGKIDMAKYGWRT